MKTIFKYMNFLDMDYFDDPTARISLIDELNDPFECSLSHTIFDLIKRSTHAINSVTHNTQGKEITEDEVAIFIFNALRGIGVISFSETHRNLLMWAHYAGNHSGICIEVESDWSKSKARLSDTQSNSLHRFQRVQYDTMRVDFNNFTSINVTNFHETLIDILTKQLTIKSDEWMYEKEHRYILSFLEADYVKQKKDHHLPDEYKVKIDKLIKKENIQSVKNGYLTTNCTELELFYECFQSNAFMYLTKIPANKIKRIYLGHRFNKDKMQELIEKMKAPDHPLHNTELYKCKISDSRFEIETQKVYG
ncbi:DUF2971 domain-containing protein [Aeromonas veronii]